jgi:hypothetical protein
MCYINVKLLGQEMSLFLFNLWTLSCLPLHAAIPKILLIKPYSSCSGLEAIMGNTRFSFFTWRLYRIDTQKKKRKIRLAGHQWLTPVILAIWEAEIGRIGV